MKKKERRTEDPQWINAMCDVLIGGALAGLVAILALLLCAVLLSIGIVPVDAMYGVVLAVCVAGYMPSTRYRAALCWWVWVWERCCFSSC